MASALLNFAGKLLADLCSPAVEDIKLVLGFKANDEFEKLKATVSTIKGVLLDAEEKQASNHEIEDWLKKIKDAFYEADDLLDDFLFEDLRRKVMNSKDVRKLAKEVRIFFSRSNQLAFRLRMGRKVKLIRGRLDSIAADRKKFHLIERLEDMQVDLKGRDEETHSFVSIDKVIGREEDKDVITKLLVEPGFGDNVGVISIVGIGGLGKTTLAQVIYNVENVKKHFELMIWVCVSVVFDVKVICEKIVESATKRKCERLQMDVVKDKLKKAIDGKKFLLVLDDVWNDDHMKWMRLEELLRNGARGSKILVTTRTQVVAQTTRSNALHVLGCLSKKDSWTFFKQLAFKGLEPNNPTILRIANETVEKCAGVPLAIKSIGSLLSAKHEESEWLYFRNYDLPKITHQTQSGILPILKLSYDDLPAHLKPCFTHCAVFPKDHKIEKMFLIRLWIAHGMIQLVDRSQCQEDVGEQYFIELLRRSFFQPLKEDVWGNDCYKMHDLIHDLAQSIEGNTRCNTDLGGKDVTAMTRHVWVSEEIPTSLFQAKKLRTVLLQPGFPVWALEDMSESTCDKIMSSFKKLRVLDLHRLGIPRLSSLVGGLKHLKYLDLSYKKFESLPESICELYNLQTLKLFKCWKLKELPKGIKNLVSLRHLDINHCNKLSRMPRGMGLLTSLQTLTRFILDPEGRLSSGGLGELKGLFNLRGVLEISELRGSIVKRWNTLSNHPNYLTDMRFLETLSLSWQSIDISSGGSEDELLLFETLCPHPNLKKLVINHYGGVTFPTWMNMVDFCSSPCLPNVVEISLYRCQKLRHLPPLGLLPSLQVLRLKDMDLVEYVYEQYSDSSSQYGSSSPNALQLFPSLKILHLAGMLGLKELGWRRKEGAATTPFEPAQDLSVLEELHIEYCSQLTLLYDGEGNQFKSLESIRTLCLLDMPNLESLPRGLHYLTKLQSLSVSYCPDLVALPESMGNLISLQYLQLNVCESVASLPDCMPCLTSLQQLQVVKCPQMEKRCKEETGEDWSKIAHIPDIVVRHRI